MDLHYYSSSLKAEHFFGWLEPSEEARYTIMPPICKRKKNICLGLEVFFYLHPHGISYVACPGKRRVWNLTWNFKKTTTNNISCWKMPFYKSVTLNSNRRFGIEVSLSRSHPMFLWSVITYTDLQYLIFVFPQLPNEFLNSSLISLQKGSNDVTMQCSKGSFHGTGFSKHVQKCF